MFEQTQEAPIFGAVASVGPSERITFLRKTYVHLAAAIFAFVALEYAMLSPTGPLHNSVLIPWLRFVFSNSWFIVLALFMGGSYLAQRWANSDTSKPVQYLGLGLYIVVEAFVFAPILFFANTEMPGVISDAATLTLFIFAGLTATVFITRKDFSFMRGALSMATFGAMGLIVVALLTGLTLGTFFSGFMILVASGYVLYYTSNVMHHYRSTQYVAASLALFSAIALLFWYVLRILMSLRD